MSKKDIAISFLKLASSGAVRQAYDRHVHRNFRHHNVYFKGDRESLMRAMEEASVTSSNRSIEVQHTFENGDFTAIHSRVVKTDSEIAVVHIFRFEGESIIELWDTGMVIPKDSPNENGAF